MKLIHLSDLHLGKRVNDFPMLEDQAYILDRILEIIDGERPDAVLIAGDVYDKTVPSAEAVALLDDFLVKLADRSLPVLLISGNHDSPERLAFANRLMEGREVYIAPVYHGEVAPVTLEDAHGPVDFWLLPFLKPAHLPAFSRRRGWRATPAPWPAPSGICPSTRPGAMCWSPISLSRGRNGAHRRRSAWAERTTWTPPFLPPLTMWP